jgi:L-fuconolactonase
MRLDAHQHFWALARGDYGWLTPELAPIYRDFLPDDLSPILSKWNIDGTVLVQAAPTVAETRFMLDLAHQTPFIKGVVGWIDFEAADAIDQLNQLAQDPYLLGIRPMIQDIPDVDWMLNPQFTPVFEAIIHHDLVFDALTLPQHLTALHQLAQRHPEMRIVIDHGAKPLIAKGQITDWAADMTALAALENIRCKLSGLVTEAGTPWARKDLEPYVQHLLQVFGPHRLIWGSDWPVCTLAASYDTWMDTSEALLADLSAEDRAAIFGLNSMTTYNIRT